ncbi:hypothetical protein EV426DRAFT_252304 [Tirmania nivea]|nr:hypothetical protein EV426DRAFT_252304 [Tirmania nivea]
MDSLSRRRFLVPLLLVLNAFFIFFYRPPRGPNSAPTLPNISPVDSFSRFEGYAECGITAPDLYERPPSVGEGNGPYCPIRSTLLKAMSEGGRHGFDAPFVGKGCTYKWFSTDEICMILERFDTVVFIGDTMLRNIYGAFNILLRQNQALGAISQWEMSDHELNACRCDAQFTNPRCHLHFLRNSTHFTLLDPLSKRPSPSLCPSGTAPDHYYVPITSSPVSMSTLATLASFLYSSDEHPEQKLVPIIFHIGLSLSFSWPQTVEIINAISAVLEEITPMIRYRPLLWLNPAAAGHLKPPGVILQQGNEALWGFSKEMEKQAKRKGWEVLGMWNATVQADSWDGSNYGEN